MMQTGFPDFICYKLKNELIFVECKTNGKLDKTEKLKARWYLENKYCSKFLIASKLKIKNRIHINYEEFTSDVL